MAQLKPTKTVYTVSDFLSWQKNGELELKPIFQRREVWSPKAKSLLIDSVVKGLPMPIIFLRKRQDLKSLSSKFEVVDGQQRLRTLFTFLAPKTLEDYKSEKDDFKVLAIHNSEVADTPFSKLPEDIQTDILGYEISTHVLPPDTEDEVVLRIFARLNSTGAKLNHQELRNAQFFGTFKSLAYDLAVKNLSHWRQWAVFDDDDLARMVEVETTSDLLICMMTGLQGKSQAKLDSFYEDHDDILKGRSVLANRFQKVMEVIEESAGALLANSRLRRQALFFSLYTACYDHVYGLKSDYSQKRVPTALPKDFGKRFLKVNARIVSSNLPEKVLDAMEKATADTGRRIVRHKFFMESLGLVPAE